MAKAHVSLLLGIACVVGIVHTLAAQTSPSPTFEVASIKRSTTLDAGGGCGCSPGASSEPSMSMCEA